MKVHDFPVASRIDAIPASIWYKYSNLARETGAVNLGQGFSDDVVPEILLRQLQEVSKNSKATIHQYPPGAGHPVLTSILAEIYTELLGWKVDAQKNIVVTVGAQHALYYAFLSFISEGDNVIVIEPAFDCYATQIRIAGGNPIGIPLREETSDGERKTENFRIDFEKLEEVLKTNQVKALVLNNPHNPIGKVFSREELEKIGDLAEEYNFFVISDEVYEYQVLDKPMIRFASLPNMAKRTITVGSGGKCFNCTGWKLGWAIAPSNFIDPIKKIHGQATFCCSTPLMVALGQTFAEDFSVTKKNASESYLMSKMPTTLKAKRDKLVNALRFVLCVAYRNAAPILATEQTCSEAGFDVVIPEGGIFIIANYKNVWDNVDPKNPEKADEQFVEWLTVEKNLAAIPISPFYLTDEVETNYVRFCFNKSDEVLDAAVEILRNLKKN